MKLERIAKLAKLMKDRALIEQARLAAVRRARQSLLDEAAAIEKEARADLEDAEDLSGLAVQNYAARQNALESKAKAARADAAALIDPAAHYERALRVSLKREAAWDAIEKDKRAVHRAQRNAQEEERREGFTQLQGRRSE